MNFLYFAYGSNMLPARLRARCESARVVGPATAPGFKVQFSKVSQDGSGKATLLHVSEGASSTGVLFEINRSELGKLDKAEGKDVGYERVDNFPVDLIEGRTRVEVATYIATSTDVHLKPFDWYLALVIGGAYHHKLGDEYVSILQLTEHRVDTDHSRRSRVEAVRALEAHGFSDYRVLLKNGG